MQIPKFCFKQEMKLVEKTVTYKTKTSIYIIMIHTIPIPWNFPCCKHWFPIKPSRLPMILPTFLLNWRPELISLLQLIFICSSEIPFLYGFSLTRNMRSFDGYHKWGQNRNHRSENSNISQKAAQKIPTESHQ